jgi:hypothetical protein
MNLAVWRVSAPDFDVDAFLAEFPRVASKVVSWRRGEVRVGSRVHKDSGFRITIADAETFPEAFEDVRAFFGNRQTVLLLEALLARGISSVLDLGVDVGSPQRFAAYLHFSTADLQWLARLGVELEISAYPASEDDESEDDEPDATAG